MAGHDSTAHILQSLVVNFVIAVAKGIGAFVTGSGAMLAETIHSFADCSNQVLLLIGVRGSRRAPTADHPLGFGRDAYFWSFMVALLLFSGGGVFSMYEGIHKFHHPEPVTSIGIGIGILIFAIVLEGYATLSNIRTFNQRRGSTPLFKYLRSSKEAELVVVFGENSAATLGLLLALFAQILAWISGDSRWDALGCLAIGFVLILVALFLAVEVKSLLMGERASPLVEESVRTLASQHPGITKLLHMISIQQGPGQVILLMKLGFDPSFDAGKLSDTINAFEQQVRQALPEVRWCFVEPDRPR